MADKVQDFLIFRVLGHDVMVHREIDIRCWFGDGNSKENSVERLIAVPVINVYWNRCSSRAD